MPGNINKAADFIKIKVQRIVLAVGIILFIIKLTSFYLTHSVSILSDALESTVNVITAIITLKSLQFAAIPRDKNHPYGHGKIELLTASIEGILIVIAGIMIIREAILRLYTPIELQSMHWGIVLLIITAIINFITGYYSIKTGKKYGSVSLISGGHHLYSDTYSTIALVGGLLIYYLTGLTLLDSILAIILGLIIIYTGYKILKATSTKLMDEANPKAIQRVLDVIVEHKPPEWIDIHKLTFLEFGNFGHIDMHLTLPWYYNMREMHASTTLLKNLLREKCTETDVDISIQCEPCLPSMCYQCKVDCPVRVHPFSEDRIWTIEQITGNNIYNATNT
ncbi:MAG TPA: cation diffusion facilitator family transporter [Saprospiraceae bacterium]|nr:cation transporter [Saprospiraceae bacterium]HRO09605.1 cation diffusion facilitator family transporter [Saprospiraceae bacterium]HRP42853.1 cation diffusion facilitator family transporter [Saprospiraceae bacterium]